LGTTKNPVGGAINSESARTRVIIEEAESAIKTGNPSHAVELLMKINLPEGSHERQLFLEAALDAKDWQAIIGVTAKPYNSEELVWRVEALIMVHDYHSANNALDNFSQELKLHEQIAIDLRKRIHVEEVMRG